MSAIRRPDQSWTPAKATRFRPLNPGIRQPHAPRSTGRYSGCWAGGLLPRGPGGVSPLPGEVRSRDGCGVTHAGNCRGGPTAISFCLAVEVVEALAPVLGRPMFLRVLYLVDLPRHLCMFANAVVVPSPLFHPFRAAFLKAIESVLCAVGGLCVPQVRLASK